MLRTGIDIVPIARIQAAIERHGDAFLTRVFTQNEIATYRERPASLAARWAAKEAVAKAFGTGLGAISFYEIEILSGTRNEPILTLHGNARKTADELGLTEWAISLSHTDTDAIAVVVVQ